MVDVSHAGLLVMHAFYKSVFVGEFGAISEVRIGLTLFNKHTS